jgi:hypothetical protein
MQIRAVCLAALLALSASHATAQATSKPTVLEGTWEYAGSLKGWTIYRDNTYIMYYTRPDSAAKSVPPSESDYARLFRSLGLQSGTFSVSDSVVTMNQTMGKFPNQKPITWRWLYTLKGDTMTWRVLNAQGVVNGTGISVRVRDPR